MSRILKTGTNQITQKYSSIHKGIDIVKYKASLDYIVAHSDGVVVEVVSNCNKTYKIGGSYGNYVRIKHSNGYYTLYAHMKYKSVTVLKGQKVKKGQVIGYMGNTGHSLGAHLHFEVRDTKNNKINPIAYINEDLPNMSKKTVSYRVYSNNAKRWFNVAWNGDIAGNEIDTIGGIQVKTGNGCGSIKYRVHLKGRRWLNEVIKCDDTDNGYAGIKGKNIDGFTVKSEFGKLIYRVKIKKYGWLPWVNGYNIYESKNGYAGILNYEIVAIQIKFI